MSTKPQAMRDLLQILRANILHDTRVLCTFESFAGPPQSISRTSGDWPEEVRKREDSIPDSIRAYFQTSFPTLNVFPPRYVATTNDDTVGVDLPFHPAIDVALAENSEDPLLQFLVVVAAIHNLGHTVRKFFWPFVGQATSMEAYPFYCEKECPPGNIYAESGFAAEIALFGGVIGVVFQDEKPLEFDFFDLDYTRIAYFCITPPSGVTYKIDKEVIRTRMLSSSWLDTFVDEPNLVSTLPAIETPLFFQHRLCAVLNSTHLARPDADVLALTPNAESKRSLGQARVHRLLGQLPETYFEGRRRRCVPDFVAGAGWSAPSDPYNLPELFSWRSLS
ncbi:hypothetical protein C8R47DRAFT_1315481 [Mycena vitilis]|nr:hypothetical protein C8R47DRAFT_1315481 [Mycena vitilis]